MLLTMSQAAKECGRAKSTLSKAIKSGKLSADPQEDGSYKIDPAELFRVFPPKNKNEHGLPTGNPEEVSISTVEMAIKIGKLEAELEAEKQRSVLLNEQLGDVQTDRDEWRKQAQQLALSAPPEATGTRRKGLFGLWGS